MKERIGVISCAVSLRILAGSRSGPVALFVLRLSRSLVMPASWKVRSAIGGAREVGLKGMLVRSSLVRTLRNCLLRACALSRSVSAVVSCVLSVGIVPESVLLLLMYCQNGLGLFSILSTTLARWAAFAFRISCFRCLRCVWNFCCRGIVLSCFSFLCVLAFCLIRPEISLVSQRGRWLAEMVLEGMCFLYDVCREVRKRSQSSSACRLRWSELVVEKEDLAREDMSERIAWKFALE